MSLMAACREWILLFKGQLDAAEFRSV